MNAKIRQAQLMKVPYMLVVGEEEMKAGKVALRVRDGSQQKDLDLGASSSRGRRTGSGGGRRSCRCGSSLQETQVGEDGRSEIAGPLFGAAKGTGCGLPAPQGAGDGRRLRSKTEADLVLELVYAW